MSLGFDEFPYGLVASFYDELAAAYSLGQIGRSKRYALRFMQPGERVLFAGVGRGREAIEAAAQGQRVSAVDVSREMLARFEARLSEAGQAAAVFLEDVSGHDPVGGGYDVVVANYFLNLFEEERALAMLRELIRLTRPGGKIVIADFAAPGPGVAARWIAEAYYRPVNVIAWGLGLCALHPVLDYPARLEDQGLTLHRVERFAVVPALRNLSPGFVSVVAERAPVV